MREWFRLTLDEKADVLVTRCAFLKRWFMSDVYVGYLPRASQAPAPLRFMDGWRSGTGLFYRYHDDKEHMLISVLPDTLRALFGAPGYSDGVGPIAEALEAHIETLASRFRSGSFVPIDGTMEEVLGGLLPANSYLISSRTVQFRQGTCDSDAGADCYIPSVDWLFCDGTHECTFSECLARPRMMQGPVQQDGWETLVYWCPSLLLTAAQLHDTIGDRVAYYKQLMLEDDDYLPCVLLFSPWEFFQGHENPKSMYGTSTVILDGHHKMKAALLLDRQVQIIVVQNRDERYKEKPAFPWVNACRRDAYEYLMSPEMAELNISNGVQYTWDQVKGCAVYHSLERD